LALSGGVWPMVRLIIIPRRQGRGSGIIDRTEPAAVQG
jgi:hypothetical protein